MRRQGWGRSCGSGLRTRSVAASGATIAGCVTLAYPPGTWPAAGSHGLGRALLPVLNAKKAAQARSSIQTVSRDHEVSQEVVVHDDGACCIPSRLLSRMWNSANRTEFPQPSASLMRPQWSCPLLC
uniref:Uncharacterized protein n=1 Tax=Ralstonia solanacearum TaxID=305 RepID=A0A0S4UEL2_RALSL|nr:protein of unknown function [Ralstonia solanacearum]